MLCFSLLSPLFYFFLISCNLAGAFAASLPSSRQQVFRPARYSDFQISDGRGGDAATRAAAVFIYPFGDNPLEDVSFEDYDALHTMKEAAEDADVEAFGPEMADADPNSAYGQAVAVGQTKNRVLWFTAAVQQASIKLAKDRALGFDVTDDELVLQEWQARLDEAISRDIENYGFPSVSLRWPV